MPDRALRVGQNERFGSKLAQCDRLLTAKCSSRRKNRAHRVGEKRSELNINISRLYRAHPEVDRIGCDEFNDSIPNCVAQTEANPWELLAEIRDHRGQQRGGDGG